MYYYTSSPEAQAYVLKIGGPTNVSERDSERQTCKRIIHASYEPLRYLPRHRHAKNHVFESVTGRLQDNCSRPYH
ncbi:hypothetical protein BDV24DRAFT_25379 [Aspergillus arachidicola]|uniref:Uncharacterized protein n=1 Tax=Aspergillus arachidicola TaxID=656916 RepID=A0A5N6YE65_9EURO|nr:hypothetical protein BDV24DRAFT_25379 [Aspergillus arachidicola]